MLGGPACCGKKDPRKWVGMSVYRPNKFGRILPMPAGCPNPGRHLSGPNMAWEKNNRYLGSRPNNYRPFLVPNF